ncbi:MAG: SDR family oxidoreductase [Halioglobus sp.]|nr:SDR family oxidoreductase [Halioglobus sp.]
MAEQSLSGKTALITGASSGLGVDFAWELASRGANLVLVARRQDLLERVAAAIRDASGVEVHVVATDLADDAARATLAVDLQAAGRHVDVLVNNAGLGVFGDFREVDWSRTQQMLEVDVVALTHLTRLFVNGMVERKEGWILQVGSTGSFQPSPGYAAYSAAKAYVLSFGHALHFELRGTGVSCTTVCPGVTATEFLQVSGQKKTWFHKLTMMDSPAVAKLGVNRMLKRRPEIVTGWMNALTAFTTRFTPRPLMARVAWWAMRNE